MKRKHIAGVSLGLLVILILACAFPGILTPYQPNAINFEEKFSPPSRAHPLGTDEFGRDMLARVLYGGRVTIGSAVVIAAGSIIVAILWAALSVFLGGIWDELLTRMLDILLILPSLLFALLLVSLLEPGMPSLILALTLVRWPGYARILRGDVFKLLGEEYLTAARALGAQPPFIIWRHIIPNMAPLIITLFGLSFASSILSISSLSFLGFGVQLPHPEWGALINTARAHLQTYPYLMLFPGIAIITTILLTNLSLELLEKD